MALIENPNRLICSSNVFVYILNKIAVIISYILTLYLINMKLTESLIRSSIRNNIIRNNNNI